MSVRCRFACLLSALLVCAGTGRAEEVKPVQRVYEVADLVIPVGESAGEASAPQGRTTVWAVAREKSSAPVGVAVTTVRPSATREADLIRAITRTIAPRTWAEKGGVGTIDYFPLTMSLVVSHTPQIQEQIADLLAALRRLQDIEVQVEVQLAEVAADVMQDLHRRGVLGGADENTRAEGGAALLDEAGVRRFMEAIQADPRSSVMQAPRLTVFNGQKSVINLGEEQSFVTGLEIISRDGRVIYQPKTEVIPLGLRMALQPAVAADRRSVRLHLDLTKNELASGEVPLFPITTPVEPIAENGTNVKPETFTQYIQQPRVNRLRLDRTLAIPDGHTAVLTGLTHRVVARNEFGPPVLSKIPYINRQFRTVGYGAETRHVLVLATPRVRVRPEEEEKRTQSGPGARTRICPCVHEDFRTPILGAVPPEVTVRGEEPDEKLVLRALPPVVRVPGIVEETRDNIQIVTERVEDKLDAPRCFPLVGRAQLHRVHWKCSVYYTETLSSSFPVAFRCTRPRMQVVYIDSDHLHLCGEGEKSGEK